MAIPITRKFGWMEMEMKMGIQLIKATANKE
jgi:hypothetical protein